MDPKIKNIHDLFKVVDTGQSVLLSKVIVFEIDGKSIERPKGEEAIREVLNAHIANLYPSGIRHDEYKTIYFNSRADSVVFNSDFIHVYEIKSAKDSFTRLESQIQDYRKYAERITIVMDIKKKSAFIKNHAHKYKGIEVLYYHGSGSELERASKGKAFVPTSKKFELLWKNELYAGALKYISGTSKLSQYRLYELATVIYSKKQAHDIVNTIIYSRHKESIGKKQMLLMQFLGRLQRSETDSGSIHLLDNRYYSNLILKKKIDKILSYYGVIQDATTTKSSKVQKIEKEQREEAISKLEEIFCC